MKFIKLILPILMLGVSQLAIAQNSDSQPYRTSYLRNGERSESNLITQIRFNGNYAYIGMLFGDVKYIYSRTLSDGTKLYHRMITNIGYGANVSEVPDPKQWLKVSPDRKTLNTGSDNDNTVTIYQLTTPSSAGGMVY